MASFNLTVEDSSPLISYDPPSAWSDASPDDPLLATYSEQSYHRTSSQGATATIEFYGTGLTFFGGKRADYGRFVVSVDGAMVIADGNARGSDNAVKQTLATVTGLRPGKHRAVFENIDGSPIDIDAVIISDEVGPSGAKMDMKVYDDMDPLISYSPSPAAWGQNKLPIFQDGTIHFSQNPDAALSMQFAGDAIALYGTISPDHSDMKVTVDTESSILKGGSNGGVNRMHPQMLLYYRSGLGPGQHTIRLASESANPNSPFVDLDSIAVFSGLLPTSSSFTSQVPVTGSTVTRSRSTATAGSSSKKAANKDGLTISKGALAGAIVAGVVGFIACIFLCFFAWRWRRRRAQGAGSSNKNKKNMGLRIFRSESPTSPDLPMQQEPRTGMVISGPLENSVFVFPPKPNPAKALDTRLSIAPSYYSSPDSGTHRSMSSASSGSPLIRPPLPPGARTIPAKNFRGPAPATRAAGPPYTPAPVTKLLRGTDYSEGSPRGPFATPPLPRVPITPQSPSSVSTSSLYSETPQRPFNSPPLPRVPISHSPSVSTSTMSQDWEDTRNRSPRRPVRRPIHIDFNEVR